MSINGDQWRSARSCCSPSHGASLHTKCETIAPDASEQRSRRGGLFQKCKPVWQGWKRTLANDRVLNCSAEAAVDRPAPFLDGRSKWSGFEPFYLDHESD